MQLVLSALAMIDVCLAAQTTPVKICIAEGGAADYAPEHTMASYRLALEMKADYIEADLQLSKDLKLICIHDLSLERTTNVEEVYPDRSRTIQTDGRDVKTWFVFDFTWEELLRLDAGAWFESKFAGERLVSLQQLIELVKGKAGLYLETKDPDFYRDKGVDIDEELHKALAASGLGTKEGQGATPVIIESFHPASVKRLRELGGKNYTLIQLVWFTQFNEFMTPEGLKEISKYADGVGPLLSMILPPNESIVREAQNLGLVVHPWILYESLRPKGFDSQKEYVRYLLYDLGVDGLFTESPEQFPRQ